MLCPYLLDEGHCARSVMPSAGGRRTAVDYLCTARPVSRVLARRPVHHRQGLLPLRDGVGKRQVRVVVEEVDTPGLARERCLLQRPLGRLSREPVA
jgi:hypothetical protein